VTADQGATNPMGDGRGSSWTMMGVQPCFAKDCANDWKEQEMGIALVKECKEAGLRARSGAQ